VVVAPTLGTNGYGAYTVTAFGVWLYTLDNTHAAVQALNIGGTLTDSFTVTAVDGTAQIVTITIEGANDAAVIGGDTTGSVIEAGGVANSTPGLPEASGDLDAADIDNAADSWTEVLLPTLSVSGYGTFQVLSTGEWLYTLDNSHADVEALNTGGTLTDSFTVSTTDGTPQLVTVTIEGANDAAVITGDSAGTTVEAGGVDNAIPGTPTDAGDLDAADVDNAPDSWNQVLLPTLSIHGYGSFTLSGAGVWTYTLDNGHPDVEALNVGGTLTDSFTVTTVDGTSQVVTIVISGENDAPLAVADDNDGDTVKRTVGGPGDPTATGNVLLNDVDVDADDTKSVIEVNGSAANVGQQLVGIYGTLTLMANGVWSYTLDESDPDTQALTQNQTAVDPFSYTMSDAHGATSSTTLGVTVTGGDDPPYINTISTHRFATPSQSGDLVIINGFTYQDIDSLTDNVTVTIASSNPGDVLDATFAGGVTVSGSGSSSIVLTGTIAAINAFVSGDNVRWDPPPGNFDRSFTFTIDDNGVLPGGMVVSTSVFFDEGVVNFSDLKAENPDHAGWNLNDVNVSTRGGNDTVVTAWSHGPSSNNIDYDGGNGFDTVTIVFTPSQLESILSSVIDRGALQDYLDGDVSGPFDDDTLSLGATAWNATVTDFEDASLALATGPDGFVRFTAIGENLPDFDTTPDITDDTTVGTAGDDVTSGLDGNDILVGGDGNDTLNGDAAADMLLGGSGDDTLAGGPGNDILAGGIGADRYVFAETGALNGASIVDFSFVDGDTIDLSALLDAAFVTGQPISGFVRGVQSGSNITLQVDVDGGANSFVEVATLTGYGTNSADLVRLTFEATDHVLLV
jgi:VCBS repeat-containing protein